MGGSRFMIPFPLTPLKGALPFPHVFNTTYSIFFSYSPLIHSSQYPPQYSLSPPANAPSFPFTPTTQLHMKYILSTFFFAFPFPLPPLSTRKNYRSGISNNAKKQWLSHPQYHRRNLVTSFVLSLLRTNNGRNRRLTLKRNALLRKLLHHNKFQTHNNYVVKLTNNRISPNQISLLHKGLKFVPTLETLHNSSLKFRRHMYLAYHCRLNQHSRQTFKQRSQCPPPIRCTYNTDLLPIPHILR